MKKFTYPKWAESAVFYQIYPQSYYDSNGDGIGDISGIIKKLDYIESLGVTAIWMNPCFVSPFQDAGYDVADYYKVAPRYGTNADLKKLFQEAKKRGIRILLDLVPGHTSVEHPWFKNSCKEAKNEHSNWYIWTHSAWDDGGAPYNAKVIRGLAERDGNFLINFFASQPALNFGYYKTDRPWQLHIDHPDVQRLWREMKNIMRHWLDMGASGFRVDMAGSLIRNDEKGLGRKRFWSEVRAMLDKHHPEAFIVAEWFNPAQSIPAGFHSDFLSWLPGHYDLFRREPERNIAGGIERPGGSSYFDRSGKGDISEFISQFMPHFRAAQKHGGTVAIPAGNHDLSRINLNRSETDLEIIMAFLMTFPGPPFLYYGDEIAMRHLHGVPNREGAFEPRKGARTPMQWTSGKNLGFSNASPEKLYLPVDKSKNAPNVAGQEKDSKSFLNRTKNLIALRRSESALHATADFKPLYVKPDSYPFVYWRANKNERILVALNPSNRPVKLTVNLPIAVKSFAPLMGYNSEISANKRRATLSMKGTSYLIVRCQ